MATLFLSIAIVLVLAGLARSINRLWAFNLRRRICAAQDRMVGLADEGVFQKDSNLLGFMYTSLDKLLKMDLVRMRLMLPDSGNLKVLRSLSQVEDNKMPAVRDEMKVLLQSEHRDEVAGFLLEFSAIMLVSTLTDNPLSQWYVSFLVWQQRKRSKKANGKYAFVERIVSRTKTIDSILSGVA